MTSLDVLPTQAVIDEPERCLASVERVLEVRPIDGADNIELVLLLGWQVVVQKSLGIKPNMHVIYFRIDAILPAEHPGYAFLAGKPIRTRKMLGQLSQGLVGPLDWAEWHGINPSSLVSADAEGKDLTLAFKITKTSEGGVDGDGDGTGSVLPNGCPKTRQARVQDCPRIIRDMVGKPVVMTKKLDGCSMTVMHKKGEFATCSRTQHLEAVRDVAAADPDPRKLTNFLSNAQHYFDAEVQYDLKAKLASTGLDIALQGELCGPKINQNRLRLDKLMFRAYAIYDLNGRFYWSRKRCEELLNKLDIEMVPVFFRAIFPEDWASVTALLSEAEKVRYTVAECSQGRSDTKAAVEVEDLIAEGFVCMTDSDDGVLHHTFKCISNTFLLQIDAPHAKKPASTTDKSDKKKIQQPAKSGKDKSANFVKPLVYAPLGVDESHWARAPLLVSSVNFCASLLVDQRYLVQVKLNPSDARGYRSIVFLADQVDPTVTLNRAYTLSERAAVFKALALVCQAYNELNMLGQVEVAGNNSQSFDSTTGMTTVGSKEPSFLHGHVIGRGNPQTRYVAGVMLRGPVPGDLFNMREGKEAWASGEMERVAVAIAAQIERTLATSHPFGVTLVSFAKANPKPPKVVAVGATNPTA